MKFEPKTEKQIADERLLPDGEYDVEIVGAVEKTSKKGNQMLEISVRVFGDSRVLVIRDYLLENQQEKLLNLCTACGIPEKYHAGELEPSDLQGLSCRAKIKVEPPKDGYDASNRIKSYVKPKGLEQRKAVAAAQKLVAEAATANGDDIPF